VKNKIDQFQNALNVDRLIQLYLYLFLAILLYQVFFYYTFYPFIIFKKYYQFSFLTKKFPLIIGLIYLMIFHVAEKKQWWITIPITVMFMVIAIDDAASGKFNLLYNGYLSGKTAWMTFFMFVSPLLMVLATAYVGISVWWQKDYD
jgi:hypothetical protein